ncbi:T-cell surface protein tactile [Antechinus flavipes]|uniref:T-cell surface protein tactile n=1 Tax=Antechinus flavipes TaxID=38775 RepID=UPI0022360FBD|nr:T-cell surface protein tactile [Antechinus flavipes]XP_051841223.1 T-cell surface protein tactile [Antechinus flavipes]XP_051841224.1 T-cell surface protein tactile [Antechinus flavipes]XP_051841225.1 T-cell surface protein tactile [Antechinus flavipes]
MIIMELLMRAVSKTLEKKWTYGVIYSFMQIHLIWGLLKGRFDERNVIYATPGMDVNLTCQLEKKSLLVQTQWSKITNNTEIIGLYHPSYGYNCGAGTSCESLVSFTALSPNVSEWTLYLRNVSSASSGKYECSFTLFPEGTLTKIQNLLVQNEVAQDEKGGNYTVEALFNHILKIPCFQNISSVISSGITVAWLMEKNGKQETLIQNSTFIKNRNILLKDHELYLPSVEIFDDDRKFSCHVIMQSGKILKNVTRIKVFAKPEIFMNMQNSSTDTLEEKNFSCLVKNIFPTANLSWYIDGELLQNEKEGIYTTIGKRKSDEGFYELTSNLKVLKPNQPILPNNLTVWCMTLFPVPGNEVWNISSRKIVFSFSYTNTPTDPSNIISTTSIIAPSLSSTGRTAHHFNSSVTTQRYADHSKKETESTHQFNSTVTTQSYPGYSMKETEPTSQFNSNVTRQSYPDHSKKGTEANLGMFTLSYSSRPSEVDTTLNGTVSNIPKSRMPWPVVVAGLLFICVFLFGLGIRKWCQYWKEITERPPPFKPPPPPIKYVCIGESVGGDLPCHEMETL